MSFGGTSEQLVKVFSVKIFFHQFTKVFSHISFLVSDGPITNSPLLLQVQMNARDAEFQKQLQEKNNEINRLQNELRKVQSGVIHIVGMCIRQQNESTLKYD